MTEFWKNTRKITVEIAAWFCILGLVVCAGIIARAVWLAFWFGWRVIP